MQRNRLDSLIANARKSLAEFGKNIPSDELGEIKTVLSEAEAALASNDMGQIYSELVKVERAATRITESMMSMA